MAGRKTMSIEQIIAKGNKSHLTKDEIAERRVAEETLKKLATDKIKPPTWLDTPAKKIFKDTVKELQSIGLLANVDTYNLAIMSNSMQKYIECTQRLHSDDMVITSINKSGNEYQSENPLINIQKKYAETVIKLSTEFGLTPSARLKIIQSNTQDQDEEEEEFHGDFGDV